MSQTVSIRLDEKVLKQLDLMAKASHRSRAWLMSQAVAQYIEHEAWQLEAIRKALDNLQHGKTKFAENTDIMQWLSSWGSKDELEPPACK
jgi:predicted transcriptional regulator